MLKGKSLEKLRAKVANTRPYVQSVCQQFRCKWHSSVVRYIFQFLPTRARHACAWKDTEHSFFF